MTKLKLEATSLARIKGVNSQALSHYFQGSAMLSLNLTDKPWCLWQADETSIRCTHVPEAVIAKKGTRCVAGRVSNSRESFSALECIRGDGTSMPSTVICKGETEQTLLNLDTKGLTTEVVWTYQTKAYMTDDLGDMVQRAFSQTLWT